MSWTGTALLHLKDKLTDVYDDSNPDYPPMIAVISTVPDRLVFRGLALTAASTDDIVLDVEGSANVVVQRCQISHGMLYDGFSSGVVFSEDRFIDCASDFGDASFDIWFVGNTFDGMQRGIMVTAAGRDYHIIANHFRDYSKATNAGWAIQLAGLQRSCPVTGF